MTAVAHCPLCGYPFQTHTDHPVTPPHPMLGAPDMWCGGASQEALTEVS